MIKSEIKKPNTFLYFAYGGDIYSFHMQMMNLSADFVSIARLDNYRLDFIKYCKFWGGPSPTIVPTANAQVWGCIWRLNKDDMESLDEYIGLEAGDCFNKNLEVLTPYMGSFLCRTYIQCVNPLPRGDKDIIPVERRPSLALKLFMMFGAEDHKFPTHYQLKLQRLVHSGDLGSVIMNVLLDRYARAEPCACRVPGRIPRVPLKLNVIHSKESKEKNKTKKSVKSMI